jgi:phosphoribosylformimino-5-aminoimidazole carboxamide ribotide isomerase
MFRPCIDLHEGKVKQIIGGTLSEESQDLRTNYVSDRPAEWYASLYRRDGLRGGHLIMLGPGNETQARAALAAYPGGLQIGGGIRLDNARSWLDAGASHVIITSWAFRDGKVDWHRLIQIVEAIGKARLVLDLSCRKVDGRYVVATDRWQKLTDLEINDANVGKLAEFCSEFLVHAVDVEGLCRGIDEELVSLLARSSPLQTTYAGGAKALADLETIERIGEGRIDLTIGSALDIFGGNGVSYDEVVAFNRRAAAKGRGRTEKG